MSVNPSFSSDGLEILEGTILGKQCQVETFLGRGGFGIVTKCRDIKTNKEVAIKVNKNDPEILQQAKLEIFILEQLRCLDADRCNFVTWNGFFIDGERICLNFEVLDQNLWDYIGDRNYQGLPVGEFIPILHQLANALFHLGSLGIVHADYSPLQIMLGLPYNEAIDMRSLGLVAVELAIGVQLYPGEDDYDVLKFIIDTQGQPPDHLLDSGLYADCYFIEENTLAGSEASPFQPWLL